MDFLWIFPEFSLILIPLKMQKGGFILHRTRGADVARHRTRADATWQSHASPRGSLGGVNVAQMHGKATRVHVNARVAPRGKSIDTLACDGPRGIVGPG